ncbi:RNA polymerase sigma factor [Sphingomonas glacialis]|uniref:RNA polymerase sigma factor n=1 Tax=Sphingomonas glacialis TaxID=658225 RepID=A0ABQ3LIU8_9SPHN|nr:sigma-70 family RNA polymerase sigma factor [Sphingomonas glacialis]GHH16677.1 RNA polymerase sigma factor [Sphingomonas glacialis]
MNLTFHLSDKGKLGEPDAVASGTLDYVVVVGEAIGFPVVDGVAPFSPQQILTLALLRTGQEDREAFRELYRLTSSKLFGICLRVCRSQAAAEDMLHDVYLKIWNRAGTFDPDRGSAIAWMSTLARNRCVDWVRTQYARRSVPIEGAWEIADPTPLISEALLEGEASAGLLACLESLKHCERDAIYGAYFGGLTHADMAAMQGVPVSTMKSWVRRGLQKLRESIDDAGIDLRP